MTIDEAKLKALVERVTTDRRFCADEHHRELATGVSALLAEIERLSPPDGQVSYQQQMEAWKSASSQDLRARGELMIQVEELEAENEALRMDAERYRFMSRLLVDMGMLPHSWGAMTYEKFDEMCDQAMADAAMAGEASHG
ncbi:hypothetical protein [Pseudomonas guariconensis]|uniref:hypothetical protein n=1 Tax=Pseudomonas guariconensis TaxID=1288410 RepID=UPI002F3FC684